MDVNIFMLKIKCSWTATRENFLIETKHNNFAIWFVETCDKQGNDFAQSEFIMDRSCFVVSDLVSKLKNKVEQVNKFLTKIKEPLILFPDNIEHQTSLNQLHKDWIQVHRNKPGVDKLMYKVDPDLFEAFHQINRLVHTIENSFVYHLRSPLHWRVDNPFSLCDDWDEYNISICYTDFGKNSFEKWQSRDSNPNDSELSQWRNIGASILVNLNESRPRSAPPEYLEYCTKHKISPVISNWPLGNLVDVDKNLGHIRRMFDRNLRIKENTLRFDLL